MRLKKILISIAMVLAGLAVQAVLALPAAAAIYDTHGTATSTNLLSGSSASSINSFHYNIATLPATSSVTIQFSNDNSNWYSAAAVLNGSTTLSTIGGADLSLSALGWSGTAFYYKITLNSTTDLSATPTIDDIRLDYTPTSGYENVFVFDNYGNVGIGTTSPSGKLDIHGAGTGTGVNTQWSDLTGAAKVTILDNGNVGIGTTAPTGLLDIAGGVKIGAGYAGIGTTAPANGLLVQGSVGIGTTLPSQLFQVNNSGSTAFVVTSGGNVGIGNTSPGAKLVINSNTVVPAVVGTDTVLQLVGGAAANSRIENNAFGGYAAFLGRRADGTSASPTAVQANEIISRLDARGYGATGYSSAPRAMIDLIAGENWTDAAQGGYLSFSTTLNGGTVTSEKVRIDNSGNVGIGTTSPSGKLDIHGAGTGTGVNTQWSDLTGAAKVTILDNGNVGIGTTSPNQKLEVNGRIRMNTWTADGNTAVYYNSATGDIGVNVSDVRLKKNIQTIPNPLSIIQGITGVTYNMKTDPNGAQKTVGVIAQDVAAAMPELTFPTTGPDGEEYLSVHYDKLAPVLIEGIKQQQTQIADVNLKTSQNVETVGQLQKSVDDNLVVISGNFSAVDTKLAVQNSQMAVVNSQIAGLGAQVANINSRLTSLDTQTSAIVSQVSDLSGNMSLNEAEKSDLTSRLAAAEASLVENQHDLITFEKGTNNTLSAMLVTEDMLTSRVLDHDDRIKALEAKLATATVSATVVASGEIPANAVTQDALGNATLAGIFTAKGIVAGSIDAKNLKLGAQTSGSAKIIAGQVEIVIPSTEAQSGSKIYITPTGSTEEKILYVKKEDTVPGESFKVKFDGDPAAADIPFNWLIVN